MVMLKQFSSDSQTIPNNSQKILNDSWMIHENIIHPIYYVSYFIDGFIRHAQLIQQLQT